MPGQRSLEKLTIWIQKSPCHLNDSRKKTHDASSLNKQIVTTFGNVGKHSAPYIMFVPRLCPDSADVSLCPPLNAFEKAIIYLHIMHILRKFTDWYPDLLSRVQTHPLSVERFTTAILEIKKQPDSCITLRQCVLLCFINRRVRKIRNEAPSCPGIFSRTLRFYYVASSPCSPGHLLFHRLSLGLTLSFPLSWVAHLNHNNWVVSPIIRVRAGKWAARQQQLRNARWMQVDYCFSCCLVLVYSRACSRPSAFTSRRDTSWHD